MTPDSEPPVAEAEPSAESGRDIESESANDESAEPAPEADPPESLTALIPQRVQDDPVLLALWTKVLTHWEDDQRHVSFVGFSAGAEQLDVAALCYRAIVDSEPHAVSERRREEARKRLSGVAILAVSSLTETRSEDPVARGKRIVLYAALVLFAVLMVSLGYAVSTTLPP